MELLGSKSKDIGQDKNGEDVPKIESVEVALVHFHFVNNNSQKASKVLFTFVPNFIIIKSTYHQKKDTKLLIT